MTRSDSLFDTATRLMPGGVSSPVRAFRAVGGRPRFIARGQGPYLIDVDGIRYIDYVLSWGALALGHPPHEAAAAITRQAALGTSFGAPTELETELAQRVVSAVPSIEMVRFVSSGTEAVMSAIRLARAATGRRLIVKFDGCYHGHADGLLVRAGSGVATLGLPDSPGVLPEATADTIVVPYNDLHAVEALVAARGEMIAAILVEPVAGNMGLVLPHPGFLQGLRTSADRAGALLVFDEVMTGFRVAYGGAQALFGVRPDLTTLGKILGGGLPAAAYGGPRTLMELVAPAGPVYQAGTLSGNPLAMAAGLATLDVVGRPGVHDALGSASRTLAEAVIRAGRRAGVAVQAASIGGMWGLCFSERPVASFHDARRCDTRRYGRFFHAMLRAGVYLPPSAFEAMFVSTAHGPDQLGFTTSEVAAAMAEAVA